MSKQETHNKRWTARSGSETLTAQEICALFGISQPTFYRKLRAGILPQALPLGGRTRRYPRKAVEAILVA